MASSSSDGPSSNSSLSPEKEQEAKEFLRRVRAMRDEREYDPIPEKINDGISPEDWPKMKRSCGPIRITGVEDPPIPRGGIPHSERIDLDGRPGFATSGDWPKTRRSRGPIRNTGIHVTPSSQQAVSADEGNSGARVDATTPTENPSSGGADGAIEQYDAKDLTTSA